jgi:hypothetical protein
VPPAHRQQQDDGGEQENGIWHHAVTLFFGRGISGATLRQYPLETASALLGFGRTRGNKKPRQTGAFQNRYRRDQYREMSGAPNL